MRQKYKGPTYRNRIRTNRLASFSVRVKETDLQVHAQKDLSRLTTDLVIKYRRHIETYIKQHPEFATTLTPWNMEHPAPPIVVSMSDAGEKAGVGPMAAVAGAIAEYVGLDLLSDPHGSTEVVVENGGDIFIRTEKKLTIGIFAGNSPLSLKVGLSIRSGTIPVAVCTSSGNVGHSLSFGKADAVCVVSPSCSLADAAATAAGNRIRTKKDISHGIEFARKIKEVTGIVVIVGDEIGAWGDLELVSIRS